ncbi:GumC family protein [Klebsiella quasipneumoniae]|uniref:GumC family protein n=1 Tax=Klebsiella quasipneumoniae TaxID=1463165 RepID=UPI000598F27E|nr:polysaccharide biosynthesis tyrosine autokinase [Klebsiella quasipneumoniae]EIY5163488.1 polysaccharide biosynthesis tyrosine autokinase [Klebsiella quasipneumoniae]EIY5168440.1 polysaccharide biosynthesis tyrosine autokinase [Klebsiella quasipneumoniae]KII57217.1 capsular biosynthesis protein [Klebsiella quasipneumoniae]MDM7179529.1 polysaccharide biosynthesis tyrosine autokinase [Klebsiella quasipneumoniae subsp. similipneumoniae]MDM7303086.1 polysaccharide biosynthesis tyrosine autokinas
MAISLVENAKKKEGFIDFAPYFNKIKHKLIWCLVVVIVAAVASFILTRFMSSSYTATATVLFKAQSQDISPLPRLENYDSTRSDYYETKYALMGSRVVLDAAVRKLKLYQDAEFNGGDKLDEATRIHNAIQALERGLTITGVRTTQLVSVSMEAKSPQKAADIANGVAQAFIDYSLQQKQNTLLQAQGWNEKMMDDLKHKMDQQKADIDNFLKQNGLLTFRSMDGYETERMGIVINHLADATQRRLKAQTVWDKVRREQGKPVEQIISLPEISGHPQIQDLRIALIQTRRNLSEAAKHYGPQHPKYLQAQAQLQAVNVQLGQVLGELFNGLRQQYQIALDDEQHYQKMLNDQKANFQALGAKRDQYNTMTTALNKTEELYKSLYQRANEQKLSESFSVPDEVIYDAAVPPDRPSKPQRGLLIVMITMMALALYIMYLIVSTALDKSVNSLSELKAKTGLKASGEFPRLTQLESVKQVSHNVLYADMIHSLRLALLNQRDKPATILVTSVQSQSGSSLISELLAWSASKSRKTLLIDLDYQTAQGLSAKYPQHKKGFSQLLNNCCTPEQAIVKLDEQLDFMPRGDLQESSLLLLTAQRLPDLLANLHQSYDTLIIDTPALSQAQDSLLLAAQSDICLLVVKAGEQAARIREAEHRLQGTGELLVASVLNQVQEEQLETQEGKRLLDRQMRELISPK